MSKIYQFFSLLLIAMCAGVGATAQEIMTSLDEQNNISLYTIESYDRGFLMYAPNKSETSAWCSMNGDVTTDMPDITDANFQWVIFKTEHGCYLFNRASGKFLYKDGSGTVFTDVPQGYNFQLLPSTGAHADTHPTVLAFGSYQVNLSVNQNPSVLTNWNDTSDPGNTMVITRVDDLEENLYNNIRDRVAAYEASLVWPIKSLAETDNSKTYLITNPRGNWSYDPDFIYTDEEGNVSTGSEMLVSRGVPGATADLATENQEFVFLKTVHGAYRLYSPVAKKFVNMGSRPELPWGYAALGDAPVFADSLQALTSNNTASPLVLAMQNSQFGVSNFYKGCGGIINGYNDLGDEGNCVTIVESSTTFDPTEALTVAANAEAPTLLPASVLPESQSVLPGVLDRIELTFTKDLDWLNQDAKIYLTNEAGEQVCMLALKENAGNGIILTPWDADNQQETTYQFTQSGTYSVVVPAMTVANNVDLSANEPFDPMTGVFYNPDITRTYTVEFLEPTAVAPAPESSLHELSTFTLTFPEEVTYDENVVISLNNRMAGLSLTPSVTVDSATVTLTLAAPVSSVGRYLLVVPATAFTGVSGMCNADLTYNYQILPAPDTFVYAETNPADSAVVASLSDIAISYDDMPTLSPLATSAALPVVNAAGETVTTAVLDYDNDDWYMVHLLFADEITASGTYSVTVPEQMVWNSMVDFTKEDSGLSDGAVYNPEFTLTFTVVEPLKVVSVTPEDGVQENTLPSQVVLTFNKAVEMPTSVACRNNMSFRGTNLLALDGAVVVEDKVLTINIPESLTANATGLLLVITGTDADGSPMCYGEETDRISLAYEVVLPSDRFVFGSSDPVNGSVVDELHTVLVTMTSPYDDDFVGGFDPSKVVEVKDAEGNAVTTVSLDLNMETNGGYNQNFIMTLAEPIEVPGTYTITVPEATIYNCNYADFEADFGVSSFGAIYNPKFTLTFTVSTQTGISNVAVGTTSDDAYTLDGRKVTGKLQRGVYIVNKKKVYVK